jgi:hypothetical protein
MKCNETQSKWCKNKHEASKIIDTLETYQFALGSLVGKAKEIDMKFTREHGIVRARIYCTNPKAIPHRLDYYYDGEGFAVYFEVETLDGTVIPVGEFDMDDGENKGGEDKPNAEKEGKPEENANIPPSDGAAVDDDKRVDMQKEGKDKPSDNIDSLQLGLFSFPLNSPTKSLSDSSTKWYSMVKEVEEEGAKSAPGRVTTQRQDAQGTPAIATAAQEKTVTSLP